VSSLPWRPLVVSSLAAAFAVVGLVLVDLADHGGRNPVSLIQPGLSGPSIEVIERDFPEVQPPEGIGHDGQQFYAIARAPMHLDEISEQLDRPRYRLQRPLFPWLAWALHPTGGGTGLIWAMFGVNLVALVLLGIAAGALSHTLHGPAWVAGLAPLLPVGYVSMRISVADTLALALLVAALAAELRQQRALAVLAAVGTVFTKESMALVLVGWLVARWSRSSLAMVLTAGLTAGAWWVWLQVSVETPGASVAEFGLPFQGVVDSARDWAGGADYWAAMTFTAAVASAVVAVAFRRGHPLVPAIVLSGLFVIPLNQNVIGLDLNATRTLSPLLALSLLALVTPDAGNDPHGPRRLWERDRHISTGLVGPADRSGGDANR
jgi:hypothetical protein